MSEHDNEVREAPEEPAANMAGSSMMETLRQKHKQVADAKEVDMPIPGYDGTLVCKYRLLDVKHDIGPIQAKVAQEFRSMPEQALYGAIEAMIASCIGFYYNDGENLRPLEEGLSDGLGTVRYDERLAEFLGFEAKSARQTVLGVFGDNEPALLEHARQLSLWMQGQGQGVMENFMAGIR